MSSIIDSLNKFAASLGAANFIVVLILCAIIGITFVILKKKTKQPVSNGVTTIRDIEKQLSEISKILREHINESIFYNKDSKEKFSKIYDELLKIDTKLSVWIDSADSIEDKVDKINITTQLIKGKQG